MLLFGFEVDSLEVALMEQLEMVDKLFLVEATATHKGVRRCLASTPPQMSKVLVWERLKFTERFQFVDHGKVTGLVETMVQVEHVVVDDRLLTREAEEEEWWAEYRQTDLGVARVRDWAADNLQPDDIFISAAADEVDHMSWLAIVQVMSRSALQQLRWCGVRGALLAGALWHPLGRLDRAAVTRVHVQGHTHLWALPTIYRSAGSKPHMGDNTDRE